MEKISANSTAEKVLVSRIHQEVLKLKRKKKGKECSYKTGKIHENIYSQIYTDV